MSQTNQSTAFDAPSSEISAATLPGTLAPGSQFDRFLIQQLLGRGGMGEVYLAEQQLPLVRTVALKLITDTRLSVRERAFFELESQVLARMQHPNVAQIFEVGQSAAGRPFIAMEFVNGARINAYCDQAKLDLRARLRLFLAVLKGVQHAHQKGVIHRDLKPANILVSVIDRQPIAKLIDFGIALNTGHAPERVRAGTPDYMSPEQEAAAVEIELTPAQSPAAVTSGPQPSQIDTRSDIYSLGIVLYELLTGALPFEENKAAAQRTGSKTLQRAEAVLNSMSSGELIAHAQVRRLDVRRFKRSLSGDLSWILWRATRPDREDRYESADAFSADIQRYLRHETVLAAPRSTWLSCVKFVRRHQLAVTLGTVALSAILVGTALAISGYHQARIERDLALVARAEAESERRASDAVSEFMTQDLLQQADVNRSGDGAKITVLEAIENANADLGTRLRGQPGVEGRVRFAIGVVLKNLSQFDKAEPQLQQAYAQLSQAFGTDSERALEAYVELASLKLALRDFNAAKPLFDAGYQRALKAFGPDAKITLNFASQIAVIAWQVQDIDVGIAISERSLQSPTIAEGGADRDRGILILNNLGRLYRQAGRLAEAEQAHLSAIDYRTREFGAEAFATLEAINDLAGLYRQMQRLDDAEKMYRKIIVAYQHVYGAEHASTATAINNLAKVLSNKGQEREAVTLYRQALGISTQVLGATNYLSASIQNNLAASLIALNRPAEALPLFLAADAVFDTQLPPAHKQRQSLFSGLAKAYAALGRPDDADRARAKLQSPNP
jgi:eukaryotic-like serine/threonine-protein kinase